MIDPGYPVEGAPVSALWGRRVRDALASLRIIAGPGVTVQTSAAGTCIAATRKRSDAGLRTDYSEWVFGFQLQGNTAVFNGGDVNHGDYPPVVVGDFEKEITADGQYVYVEYDTLSHVASVADPTVSKPVSDAVVYRIWLARFRFYESPGVVYNWRVNHLGSIEIPARYA